MTSDAASQPSPAASVASSATQHTVNLASHKRSAPLESASPSAADSSGAAAGALDAGDAAKKRRTGPGSRGVANLTPDQLAKKRANDREAQRAIRERTKNQIENLERKIQDLTSQQPYQDLQAALRAKEAVEVENADIKRRLATVMSLLQPLISQGPHQASHEQQQTYTSPTQNFPLAQQATSAPLTSYNASTPNSTHSPGSSDHHPAWQIGSTADQQAQGKMLSQQQHDLRHNLELGPEKLGLNFLLDPNRTFPTVQGKANGAQDNPHYQHVPMKHDWTAVHYNTSVTSANGSRHGLYYGGGGQGAFTSQQEQEHQYQQQQDRRPPTAPSPLANSCTHTEFKNGPPTCPLDSLLLDFLHERRQRAADGLSPQELVGPRYPSVSSLLNPANGKYSHPLSKVFTDILSTFPDLSGLPERVAVLYIMFLVMRWQIAPDQENLERLPSWARPVSSQFASEHPSWIDHLPFPLMRERLSRDYNPRDYHFDTFFIPFTGTLSLNWPYEDTDTLLVVPDTNDVMINPVFERHMRRLENWTLGEPFAKTFPSLDGTYRLRNTQDDRR